MSYAQVQQNIYLVTSRKVNRSFPKIYQAAPKKIAGENIEVARSYPVQFILSMSARTAIFYCTAEIKKAQSKCLFLCLKYTDIENFLKTSKSCRHFVTISESLDISD